MKLGYNLMRLKMILSFAFYFVVSVISDSQQTQRRHLPHSSVFHPRPPDAVSMIT